MEQMVLEPVRAGMAIHELILEAHQDNLRERRSATRHPFFRPVAIRGQAPECVAFSREISTVGIGLLHNVEFKQGDLELTADQVATRLGTISYEVVSQILARVPRIM